MLDKMTTSVVTPKHLTVTVSLSRISVYTEPITYTNRTKMGCCCTQVCIRGQLQSVLDGGTTADHITAVNWRYRLPATAVALISGVSRHITKEGQSVGLHSCICTV